MKAKLIESYNNLTVGKIYEVGPYYDEDGVEDDYLFSLINDIGKKTGIFRSRFEVQPADLIDQIKEAEEHLADLKQQLEEQNTPKVGQRYLHREGHEYVLAEINHEFALVCYKGGNIGASYGDSSECIKDVFQYNNEFFTLITE